jgi:hypothetical protein
MGGRACVRVRERYGTHVHSHTHTRVHDFAAWSTPLSQSPEEVVGINRQIVSAYCGIAELFMTDLWYVHADVPLGARATIDDLCRAARGGQ